MSEESAGPTRQWKSRPRLETGVALVIRVAPLVLVTVAAWWAYRAMGRPASWSEAFARWVAS